MLQHSRKTYNNDQQECAVTLQNTLVWLNYNPFELILEKLIFLLDLNA